MWAGIAAMSAILPFMEDMHYRVRKRIVGNIAGVICLDVYKRQGSNRIVRKTKDFLDLG